MQLTVVRSIRFAVVCAVVVLAASRAYAFVKLGGAWATSDGPVEYYVHPEGSDDVGDGSDVQAVKYSFRSWECVLCSDVQFRYMGDGPREAAQDGINSVFWLEDVESWQNQTGASVDAVLGITMHYEAGEGVIYAESDIAFNGTDGHTWSTTDPASGIDIESVSVHETGHFAGLGHPCTDPSEAECLGADQAVMTPAYPGGTLRDPLDDDRAGLCAVYTRSKTVCEGKKRLKEPCERDCDCEDNLFCIPDGAGRMCSRTCTTDDATCPKGTGCVLGADSGGQTGFCLRNPAGSTGKQDGSVCSRDTECESNRCQRNRAVDKMICVRGCTGAEQCNAGYTCVEGACLLPSAGEGVPCPPEEHDDRWLKLPGCSAAHGAPSGLPAALWLLLLASARLTRRSIGQMTHRPRRKGRAGL